MKRKVKAVRYFAGFMIFMFICTIVSRGIYAYQMPQVIVGRAEEKVLSHKLVIDGTVSAIAEQMVLAEAGIRVEGVYVQPGAKIEAGSVLFRLDVQDLENLKKITEKELAIDKQKRRELQESRKLQKQVWERNKQRADEDLRETTAGWEETVAKIRAEYDAVCKKLDKYSVSDYSPEKEELKREMQEKQQALTNAEREKADAVKQAVRNLEDASLPMVEQSSEIQEMDNQIADKEQKLQQYEAYLQAEGAVFSEETGRVRSVDLATGERTTDGALVVVDKSTEGWLFGGTLSKEESQYVQIGDKVTLEFKGGDIEFKDVPVSDVIQQDENSYRILVKVMDSRLTSGDAGTLRYSAEGKVQECCIPLSALYGDTYDTYVYVLKEEETFLGTEYYIERRKVDVGEKNKEMAALKEEPINRDEKIIVLSDRAIQDGDKVRMLEERD